MLVVAVAADTAAPAHTAAGQVAYQVEVQWLRVPGYPLRHVDLQAALPPADYEIRRAVNAAFLKD